MTRSAVIVSTARTAIGRAYKGGFNNTKGATLGSYSLAPAIERAKIEAGEINDVVWGAALQQGAQAGNLGRQVALRSGCPIGVSGMTIDRQCSSGLMAISTAAKQIIVDNMDIVAGGGQESISLVQTPEMRVMPDPELMAMHNAVYMPMLQTAETVAKRYGISRDAQDEYALRSQQRTAAAQEAGKFDDEIVPVSTTHKVQNKETGETVRSCAIITTGPNALMEPIHDRMPVILDAEAEALWLDPATEDPNRLTALLQPYPAEEMEAYSVSTAVNSAREDRPEMVERVDAEEPHQARFPTD